MMRLSEIQFPSTRRAAEKILLQNGYEKLNFGAYSDVYEKEGSPFVLKLFSSNDKGYVMFYQWCQANAGNPHVPVFKSKIIRITDNYNAIRMERLYPLNSEMRILVMYIVTYFRGLYLRYFKNRDFIEAKQKIPEDIRNLLDNLYSYMKSHDMTSNYDIKIENFMRRGNDLVFIDLIADEYN